MESATLWVALISACAGIGSAVFAFVQAKAATDDRKDAESARDEARAARDESARLAGEANAAFIRQAEAQEEANRLKQIELTPPDWTIATVGKQTWRVTNSSKETLFVESFDVKPDSAADRVYFVSVHRDEPYDFGDSFTFGTVQAFGEKPEKLTVRYRRPGDRPGDLSAFHVTL